MDAYRLMTPDTCKAARIVLHMTQCELASAAHVGLSTVAHYERGGRYTTPSNRRTIAKVLATAGVVFVRDGLIIEPRHA